MDEQITQLDRRLTAVERDVAAFTAEARAHYATKEDLARLEARVAVIQSNYATKEDIAKLRTEIQALEARLSAQIAASDNRIAGLESRLLKSENRMMRWSLGMMVALTSIFTAVVKLVP